MATKFLFVSATDIEHGEQEFHGSPIHIIGVGKVSAGLHTMNLIHTYKPDCVINFGSCGNLSDHQVGDILRIGKVHNDIDARPLAEYGHTPFSQWKEIVIDPYSSHLCFTTDYFYNQKRADYSAAYKSMIQRCDVIDMELYAIAKACKMTNTPIASFKWVSDDGHSHDWEQNAHIGYEKFKSEWKDLEKSIVLK